MSRLLMGRRTGRRRPGRRWLTGRHRRPSGSGSEAENRTRPAAAGRVAVGFIGAGGFAQSLLIPTLAEQGFVQLRGVVTASGLSAPGVARRFGFQYAASDPSAILDDAEIDAVVIATRHDSHAELVLRALAAGKSVFVEKPLALTAADLGRIEATDRAGANGAEGRAGRPFVHVGFNRRFSPHIRAVRRFFASLPGPRVLHCRVNAGYLTPTHWLHDPAIGGGRIIGEGCHFVDLLLHLVGARPVEVYAQALPDGGRYREDNVSAQIRFADGSIATLHYLANGDRQLGKERIEVFGGGSTAVIDDFRRTTLGQGGRSRQVGHWWSTSDKGHRAELEAFAQAVRGAGTSPLPLDQALLSSYVTLSMVESMRVGRPVALLPSGAPVGLASDDEPAQAGVHEQAGAREQAETEPEARS